MNQKPKFDVVYSDEVLNFLKSLDSKVRGHQAKKLSGL